MPVLTIVLTLASLVGAPFLAQKIMSLKGGVGKGAFVGLVTLGLLQMIGMVARFLGPLGDTLALMAFIAAWFQVVKVVHGTDTASTIVFMFWHVFFLLLATSLLAVVIGARFAWLWGG